MKKLYAYLMMVVMFGFVVQPVWSAPAAHEKATGTVSYDAYGLQRTASFNAHETAVTCTGWNVAGAWGVDFVYMGIHNPHLYDVQLTQTNGVLGGYGSYPLGGPEQYRWSITGTVAGDQVVIQAIYTVGAIGTTMHMTGTIAPDGSMSGNWTDNYGGSRSGTWSTATGFATHDCQGKGQLYYSDVNGAWYDVDVSYVQVDGNSAWFAGAVKAASDASWIGQWVFAKVHDGGTPGRNGDHIWGSFSSEVVAKAGVVSQSTPGDGPFAVSSGNLVVHTQ